MVGRKRIIDLRNSPAPRTPQADRIQYIPIHTASRQEESAQKQILITWSAHEYEHRERRPHWWIWPGGGALTLIILGILIHSYFFVAFVAVAFIVLVMYGHRTPHEIAFSVTREGIFVGRAMHRFADIKSFCIFDAVAPYELSLEVDRITAPYLRLPLGDLHPNKIRAILSDFLSEAPHKEFISDHFARALGF